MRHARVGRSTRRPKAQMPPRKKAVVDPKNSGRGHFVLSWAASHPASVYSTGLQNTAVLALGAMSHNRLVRHDDSNHELLTLARDVRSVAGLFRSEAKWISSKDI